MVDRKKLLLISVAVVAAIAVLSGGVFLAINQSGFFVSREPVPAVGTAPTAPKTQPSVASNQIKLTIAAPKDKAIVSTPLVIVSGQTAPNADVAVSSVDVKADAAGNFTANITLEEGDNPIVITAVDENGNLSEQEITVTYEPAVSQ